MDEALSKYLGDGESDGDMYDSEKMSACEDFDKAQKSDDKEAMCEALERFVYACMDSDHAGGGKGGVVIELK